MKLNFAGKINKHGVTGDFNCQVEIDSQEVLGLMSGDSEYPDLIRSIIDLAKNAQEHEQSETTARREHYEEREKAEEARAHSRRSKE